MTSYGKHYNSTLKCNDIVYFPESLQNNKFPLHPKNITYNVENINEFESTNAINSDRMRMTYKINTPQNDLISFGIWGRIYTRDGKVITISTKEDIRRYQQIESVIYDSDKGR